MEIGRREGATVHDLSATVFGFGMGEGCAKDGAGEERDALGA